jgi:oxepin-CoA hydrolase/3-oxo-5,6-dehydrosuberyl-CoA semialdehyde dehydrogenase
VPTRGGGEELGCIRAVLHHMQRTAIQTTPNMLAAIGNRWVTGSDRRTENVHPFRKNLSELAIGDTFYAHTDPVAAAANPLFGGIVAHGYLVVSLAAGLFVDPRPDPSSPTSASTTCGS